MLEKIVHFGGNSASFEQARRDVAVGMGLEVSARQIQTLTERVGRELAEDRDHLAGLWEDRRLPQSPLQGAPEAVAVSVDDGKLRVRAESAAPGVHEAQWKNHKSACLMKILPQQHDADPMPEPPEVFTDRNRVAQLVGELGHVRSAPRPPVPELGQEADPCPTSDSPKPSKPPSPEVLVRSCIVTHTRPEMFGAMVAAEAHMRRFDEARCGAFLGDGNPGNWTIHEMYFPQWMPLLDFVHLVEHLHRASRDARGAVDWELHVQLVRLAWAGKPGEILKRLESRAQGLGPPPPGAADDDPREVLRKEIGYVRNNQERMDYPRARRLGLPVTSSHVESLINTINVRVKACGKFWCPSNVEAVLQVRAATLSETQRLETFWNSRACRHAGHIRASRRAA